MSIRTRSGFWSDDYRHFETQGIKNIETIRPATFGSCMDSPEIVAVHLNNGEIIVGEKVDYNRHDTYYASSCG
jgi:hypothetical protein